MNRLYTLPFLFFSAFLAGMDRNYTALEKIKDDRVTATVTLRSGEDLFYMLDPNYLYPRETSKLKVYAPITISDFTSEKKSHCLDLHWSEQFIPLSALLKHDEHGTIRGFLQVGDIRSGDSLNTGAATFRTKKKYAPYMIPGSVIHCYSGEKNICYIPITIQLSNLVEFHQRLTRKVSILYRFSETKLLSNDNFGLFSKNWKRCKPLEWKRIDELKTINKRHTPKFAQRHMLANILLWNKCSLLFLCSMDGKL